MWQHGADQCGGPEDVQVEQRTQLGVGGLLGRADVAAAGVVDQHVDPAVAVGQIPHRGLDAEGVGDVQRQCFDLVGVRGDQVVERCDAAGGRDDDVPGGDRRLGDRSPESAVRPSHQPYPAHRILPRPVGYSFLGRPCVR